MKGHIVERRRGKAIEDAVLDAAWSELLGGGYPSQHGLTARSAISLSAPRHVYAVFEIE